MGFKSKLKIGKSNPSKKLHEPKAQRVEFDKHEDGSTCIQGDQMKFKKIIDLTEVKCQGFDKIIYAKKGWTPMVTRMTTIVCCPSTRLKLEKALVRKYEERQAARRRGAREEDLWSKFQVEHEREINQQWKHFDLIPGNHVSEETLETITRQIEEVQINEQKVRYLTLPPVVLNDNGIHRLEKCIGESNWKLENGKFWRGTDDITGVLIPTSCQSSVKHCQNWVILKVERKSGAIEIYDTRREVGSYAVLQKHIAQLSELASGIVGDDFKVSKLVSMMETNQVRDPEDCGVLATLIINHLALELDGQPVFQIFAKDWVNIQRYYLMFNLEVGFTKMEIGRSGKAISEEETIREMERKSELIWQGADDEMGTSSYYYVPKIDRWDELILREAPRGQLEQELSECEGRFSEIIEGETAAEKYLFPDQIKPNSERCEDKETKLGNSIQRFEGEDKDALSRIDNQEEREKSNIGQESIVK
ncbi:hypothetical protein OXYTRIMIC_345 [Oxytricha trifallax]|uniref:Ubiquitin-like protease family profile domain-containing protein n=1 Tax=Oxytricha trifallax TaxID=1172189 RepID=A0A073I0E0_9SPIT|nr:hypothetical protein OXYTRIMIC_345 [Oxytricha trifallax]